jgi:hypothetical protein
MGSDERVPKKLENAEGGFFYFVCEEGNGITRMFRLDHVANSIHKVTDAIRAAIDYEREQGRADLSTALLRAKCHDCLNGHPVSVNIPDAGDTTIREYWHPTVPGESTNRCSATELRNLIREVTGKEVEWPVVMSTDRDLPKEERK